MAERWMGWTLGEAGTKTASKMLQKLVGNVSQTVGHVFFATMLVGFVQVVAGYLMAKRQDRKLWPDWQGVLGSCLFGIFATLSSVLCFYVFVLGGDMTINTFIITLSIVPGAIIDWLFFSHKLNRREWSGVVLAVFAGYAVLGWPSLKETLALPLWVWLSAIVAFSAAINQGITQKVKKIDPFVKNFWGGLTTVVLAILGIFLAHSAALFKNFSVVMQKLYFVSVVIGFIVVLMWNFNLKSYQGGASIAIKKLVMNGSYLISVMILGTLVFGEKFSIGKLVGVLLYIGAFVLMDKGTWNYVYSKVIKAQPISV